MWETLFVLLVITLIALGARLMALAHELPERWGREARRQGDDGLRQEL